MLWLSDWVYRRKITIDSTLVDAALSDFPVLVHLSSASGVDGTDVTDVFTELGSDANRKKIAVTTSDGETQCYVEIEKWDHANEQAWLWAKAPSVDSASDTELYIYYDSGQSDNTTYIGDTGDAAAQSVWDSDFEAVYHLAQDPNGDAADAIKDSTSNGRDLTPSGSMTTADLVSAVIGDGIEFDQSDDLLNSGADIDVGTSGLTLSAILKLSGYDSYARFLSLDYVSGSGHGAALVDDGANKLTFLWQESDGSRSDSDNAVANTSIATDGTVQHVQGVWDGGGDDGKIYVDGVDDTNTTTSNYSSWNADNYFRIGEAKGGKNVGGVFDEVRLSSVARSAAWIKADFYSCFDAFAAFGTLEIFLEPVASETGTASDAASGSFITDTIVTEAASAADAATGDTFRPDSGAAAAAAADAAAATVQKPARLITSLQSKSPYTTVPEVKSPYALITANEAPRAGYASKSPSAPLSGRAPFCDFTFTGGG